MLSTSSDETGEGKGENTFSAAITLARKGQYAEASRLLKAAVVRGECSEADALDLQARIYAQQGMHMEAEACWRKAMELNNSNPEYLMAVERLRRSRLPVSVRNFFIGALAVIVIMIAFVWQTIQLNGVSRSNREFMEKTVAGLRDSLAVANIERTERIDRIDARIDGIGEDISKFHDDVTAELGDLPTKAALESTRRMLLDSLKAFSGSVDGSVATLGSESLKRDGEIESSIEELKTRIISLESRVSGRMMSLRDVQGVEWRLSHFDINEAAADALDISIRFGGKMISVKGECGEFSATFAEVAPGLLKVEVMNGNNYDCPDRLSSQESRFLAALAGLIKYDLLGDYLALTCSRDDETVTILLKREK